MDSRPPLSRSPRALGACAAAITVAAGLLTGCSGSDGGADGTSSTTGTGTSSAAPLPSSIPNEPAARKDVSASGCVATSSGWRASGTVSNPAAKDATYTIVVSFTTKASTVLARGTTKVMVKAGDKKKWTAEASFAKTKDVQCVLRGVSID